ncbi:hypothetical protein RYX36_000751 [Vicia faba]
MLEAFEVGGDFHFRTVMNMYPYIREAVDNKEVLLEWYPHLGDDKPPVPLLKKKSQNDGNGGIRIGFDIGIGSGSFPAVMAERNVTDLSVYTGVNNNTTFK